MFRPRPSQAPLPAAHLRERSRSPTRPSNVPTAGRRAARRGARFAALNGTPQVPCEELEELMITEMPLSGALLEQTLGPEGITLIDVCRSCGANIALRPVLHDDGDSFVLEISGVASAVDAARVRLMELIGHHGHSPVPDDQPEYASAGEIEIDIPHWIVDLVVSMRLPGSKGIGKGAGLDELQRTTGVTELTSTLMDDKETLRLRAVGDPSALNQLKELVEERKSACEDMSAEQLEVPKFALGMFFGEVGKLAYEVEADTGTLLSIKGKKSDTMAHINIRGSVDKIESAKEVILERIQKKASSDKGSHGKGKGGGTGKGKQ